MRSATFERFAGACAIIVGIGGLGYSIAFVTYLQTGSQAAAEISSGALLGGALLTVAVMVGLYGRLRAVDPGFALLALLLGVAAAAGTAIHGGFDLANFINAPARPVGGGANPVDPRGLLTFGVSGLSLLVVSWLMAREGGFPLRMSQLAFLAGGLLILVYLGRLIILDPTEPALLVVAVIAGVLVNPAFFVWLGMTLRSQAASS